MSNTANIQFQFTSNFNSLFEAVNNGMSKLSTGGSNLMKKLEDAGQSAFKFNALQQFCSQLQNTFQGIIAPGIALNTQLKETQAITGLSNQAMEALSANAREMSKVFGVDAAGSMEAYKIILSQLGPSLAEHPHLLKMMGNQAGILSKQLNGDVPAAVEVLTSAMNAFGVDIKNPAEATRSMSNMMNIMSAAAKEGSAELPNIKNALGAVGGTAKLAGVSFAETNAAIQVLDKSSLKGAEGGTSLRNVLLKMSEGVMMSKDSLKLLSAEGIDISKLADKTTPLVERLKMLNPIAADAGKLAQIFGRENAVGAETLIRNANEVQNLTTKITGTNTAVESAGIIMDSYSEKMNRMGAWFKNIGVSIFNGIEPLLPFLSVLGSSIGFVANLGRAFNFLKDTGITTWLSSVWKGMVAMAQSTAIATRRIIKQGASMMVAGLQGLGSFAVGLISATAAQFGLNIAMNANPIGLIVLGIGIAIAAVGLLIKYWDDIKQALISFAAFAIKFNPFYWLIELVNFVFPGFKNALGELWDWIAKKFEAMFGWIKGLWNGIKKLFSFGDTKEAMQSGINDGTQIAGIDNANTNSSNAPLGTKSNTTASFLGSQNKGGSIGQDIVKGGSKPTTINVVVQKLHDKIEVHSATLNEGLQDIEDQVTGCLLRVLNGIHKMETA